MKHIEDMIVPERKRGIRNIPIPESRRRISNVADMKVPVAPTSPPPPLPPPPPSPFKRDYSFGPISHEEDFDFHKKRHRFPFLSGRRRWFALGLTGLLILIFAALTIFDGASLSYKPKSMAVSFDGDEYGAAKSGSGLIFSVMKISKDKGIGVPASGESEVSRKANGTIIVYNNATAGSQRLRATTRFETSDGKIYRIQNDITVPGKRLVSGKEEPGSIEVVVYADEPGTDYNIGLSDFTLPGLKGGSLFSDIYARSKTPMAGGFVGMEKSVTETDETKARAELEESLRIELLSEARAQVPDGFVLIDDLSFFTFEELPQTEASNRSSVMFNLRGNFEGVMFKEDDLATHISREKAALSPGDIADILEIDSINFAFASASATNPPAGDTLSFTASGSAVILWRTDETALKADLLGRKKNELSTILNNYPNITEANATVRPFWKTSFPSDGKNIVIKKLDVK